MVFTGFSSSHTLTKETECPDSFFAFSAYLRASEDRAENGEQARGGGWTEKEQEQCLGVLVADCAASECLTVTLFVQQFLALSQTASTI